MVCGRVMPNVMMRRKVISGDAIVISRALVGDIFVGVLVQQFFFFAVGVLHVSYLISLFLCDLDLTVS